MVTRLLRSARRRVSGTTLLFSALLLITVLGSIALTSNTQATSCSAEACINFWVDRGCSIDTMTMCMISFLVDVAGGSGAGWEAVILQDDSADLSADSDRAALTLQARYLDGEAKPQTIDLLWTPPSRALRVAFEGRQPDEQAGYSFVFRSVPVDYGASPPSTRPIRVSYALSGDPSAPGAPAADTLRITYATEGGVLVARGAAHIVGAPAEEASMPALAASPENGIEYQRVETTLWYYDPSGPGLDKATCDAVLGQRNQGEAFVALRFPTLSDSYRLPIVEEEGRSPQVELLDEQFFPSRTIMSTTLEYLPERTDWLAANLPTGPNEHWVALGVDSTAPITCPVGLSIPASEGTPLWEIMISAILELQVAPGGCIDDEIALYYCFDGPGASAIQARLSALAGFGRSVAAEDSGVVCLGPQLFHVTNCGATGSPLELHGGGGVSAIPGEAVRICHTLRNTSAGRTSVNLSLSGGWGAGWGLYGESSGQPLSNPVTLPGHGTMDFCLQGTLPVGSLGAQTAIISAALTGAPENVIRTSDQIVAQDWSIFGPASFRAHLPMLLRGAR